MSWNFSLTSADKTKLKEAIAIQEYCIPRLCQLLEEQVEYTVIPENMALNVTSDGHHDTNYAYGNFKVTLTKLV